MNFLNFLTSKTELFNFNLLSQSTNFQRENTILVEPTKGKQTDVSAKDKEEVQTGKACTSNGDSEKKSQILAGQLSQLLTQEQMLINQYMELKLKYLANCLNLPENPTLNPPTIANQDKDTEKPKASVEQHQPLRKKIKKRNKCGHDDKLHYAKGLCNSCYHKFGRNKKPWNCSHQKLYAAGMCQNCYINNYNRKRREEKQTVDKGENESMSANDVDQEL